MLSAALWQSRRVVAVVLLGAAFGVGWTAWLGRRCGTGGCLGAVRPFGV
jgi:hypothetical protein